MQDEKFKGLIGGQLDFEDLMPSLPTFPELPSLPSMLSLSSLPQLPQMPSLPFSTASWDSSPSVEDGNDEEGRNAADQEESGEQAIAALAREDFDLKVHSIFRRMISSTIVLKYTQSF